MTDLARDLDLTRYGACTLDDDGCTTCGDTAVPVRVVRLLDDGFALCIDRTGKTAAVATAFTPDAAPGAVLLVHMGVALACPEPAAPSHSPAHQPTPRP